MNSDYRDVYDSAKKQHNIMLFIGNGFDISILNKENRYRKTTSYEQFYKYLLYMNCNEENLIFNRMSSNREKDKDNWCDFELLLNELIGECHDYKHLEDSLNEIQEFFTRFLNDVVQADLLININKKAKERRLAIKSISKFLGDLDDDEYRKLKFPEKTDHYHLYNFLFVNFNYTSIFDNYIFLDKSQFDPHEYKTVDRNFKFYPNPKGYDTGIYKGETVWSSYLLTNLIHPHGIQDISRSILFGTEIDCEISSPEKKFCKSYWGQNDKKYKKYIEDTELFIIYGSSMGETDNWWWVNIYDVLIKDKAELIIYKYSKNCNVEEKNRVKELFIKSCKKENEDKENIEKVFSKIFVVLFNDDSKNVMFNY